MKAVISNRIYLEVTPEYKEVLNKELTYTIPTYNPNDPPLVIKNMARIKSNLVTIPVGRIDLIPEGYEIIDRRIIKPVKFPEFQGTLRASQAEVYDQLEDSCIINAWVSWGKTFTALAIAGKLQQKTLIIVHTIALRNQWVKEIKKVYGITPGIIGSGKMELDSPIVVGNTQSLYRNIPKISKEFGTVILDECLDYSSRITTDAGPQTIGTIVNGEKCCKVLSWNEQTKSMEFRPIIRHFKNKQDEDMIKFTFYNQSVLKCTLNHTVYSYNKGKVSAEFLMEGDYVISELSHKTSHLLTPKAKPLILGMILGDGGLSTTGTSVRIKVTQGQAQLEYLNYKRNLLQGAVVADTVESVSGYKPENSIYTFGSLSFYDTDNWRNQLYGDKGSKNTVTAEIASILTKESWSIMYQDDGSISKGKYIIFSFCGLDEVSIGYLQDSLLKLFNINSIFYTCKKGHSYLRLNKAASEVFIESIANLIHPTLAYKKGIYAKNVVFKGIQPVKTFEDYTVQQVKSIDFEPAQGGFRYNIEVEDNHNYFAGGKLVSNCHHVSSPTFSRLIDSNYCRYKIGLSGTIVRKDGKHVVFKDYFGNTLFQPPRENYMVPDINIVKTEIRFLDGARTPWANRVNHLANNEEYRHLIAMLAAGYAAKGHKVLVVSDRVHFLHYCAELVGEKAVAITGRVKSLDERERLADSILTGDKEILFGTQAIFSEGISINSLSCLILATPINNDPLLTQLIGRVIREDPEHDKPTPIIVDVHLLGNTARKQASNRMAHYIREGYHIKQV